MLRRTSFDSRIRISTSASPWVPPSDRQIYDESQPLRRITVDSKTFGGKPIIRGRWLALEHVLGMLSAEDSPETILARYPWLEPEDIRACLVYARRLVGHERVEPALDFATA